MGDGLEGMTCGRTLEKDMEGDMRGDMREDRGGKTRMDNTMKAMGDGHEGKISEKDMEEGSGRRSWGRNGRKT